MFKKPLTPGRSEPPEAPAVSDNVRMVFFSPADVAVRAGKNKCEEKKRELEDDIMLPKVGPKTQL